MVLFFERRHLADIDPEMVLRLLVENNPNRSSKILEAKRMQKFICPCLFNKPV
jgi:hypothetical protein